MSNYNVRANWSEKDALPSGDANKRVRASEHATEYAAIASAISSKANITDVTDKALQSDLTALDTTVDGILANYATTNTSQQITNSKYFQDNASVSFGNSADLQIYHNGSDSIINESGTGILKFQSDNSSSFGTVFKIENTNTTNNQAGAYISFNTPNTTTELKFGSTGTNIGLVWGNNPSHSFEEYGLQLRQGPIVGGQSAEILIGTGAPENNVGAPVGSLYLRTDGGTGSTLYVKETGSNGNTGWVAK
jgi:hypothetical protein